MRFLLSLVSFSFSVIFLLFYMLDNPNNIFWYKIINSYSLIKFSPNLLIYSIVFFILGIFFFIFFSNFTYKKINEIKKEDYYPKLLFIFIILIFYLFKKYLIDNIFIQISSLFFIFSVFTYGFLLTISEYRKNLKYLGLIYIYISIILNIVYLFLYDLNILIFIMLLYWTIFNFNIHKKYTNYVSLFFSIISILFLIYFLYFFLFELYIKYISIFI